MQLSPNAQVYGSDGHIGHAERVIINPVSKKVTHLVVKAEGVGGQERLVPIDAVKETHPNRIELNSDKGSFNHYDPFIEKHFVDVDVPAYINYGDYYYGGWGGMAWPYVSPIDRTYKTERIPEGELSLRRGMSVDASDGHIGRIDEFIVEPKSGRIGHLVMRQGHVFGEKDVPVPISEIKEMDDEHVLLKLDKHEVEALAHIPVSRLWEVEQV